jgi:hypothetical protein
LTDWKARWQPLVDAVGREALDDPRPGADPVEASTIRRWLEPLELTCPLHTDAAVARAHGYADIVAPAAAVMMYALPAMWNGGEPPIFTTAERNSQPERRPTAPRMGVEPDVAGHFATDFELELLEPVVVGDRLRWTARRLVGCELKETRVGRGAFCKWVSEILNQHGVTVARIRLGTYIYDPHLQDGA